MQWLQRLLAAWRPAPLPADGRYRLIDVRTPQEYATAHLDGALSLPLDRIEALAAELLPDRNACLVLYCHSGMRARMARRLLQRLGYRQLVLGGGMAALAARLKR